MNRTSKFSLVIACLACLTTLAQAERPKPRPAQILCALDSTFPEEFPEPTLKGGSHFFFPGGNSMEIVIEPGESFSVKAYVPHAAKIQRVHVYENRLTLTQRASFDKGIRIKEGDKWTNCGHWKPAMHQRVFTIVARSNYRDGSLNKMNQLRLFRYDETDKKSHDFHVDTFESRDESKDHDKDWADCTIKVWRKPASSAAALASQDQEERLLHIRAFLESAERAVKRTDHVDRADLVREDVWRNANSVIASAKHSDKIIRNRLHTPNRDTLITVRAFVKNAAYVAAGEKPKRGLDDPMGWCKGKKRSEIRNSISHWLDECKKFYPQVPKA